MRRILSFAILAVVAFAFTSQDQSDVDQFRKDVANNKKAAKAGLSKFKYDGSKITYFNYRSSQQVKEVEVFLFNRTEYKFSFNADLVKSPINVKIYNADINNTNRKLLYEKSNIKESEFVISNYTDLGDKTLRRVYVDYEIPGSDYGKKNKGKISSRGAIVLAMGYKG